MSNKYNLLELDKIAVGLNIEGCRLTYNLPENCDWFNIIQIIDEPLKNINFDDIMKKVKDNNYKYIEQAIEIDLDNFINQLVNLINNISKEYNKNEILIHVHQYTGTTILDRTLEEKTGIKSILDTTNFFETPTNYKKEYPYIKALISISQCAGFGKPAGTWIVPTSFMDFDVKNNIIHTEKMYAINKIKKYLDNKEIQYIEGNILVVNDLWNPDLTKLDFVYLN